MQIELNKIYIPSKKIVSRLIDDTLIIVPVETGTGSVDFDESLYSLEETGKKIWEKLNSHITIQQLCSDLANEYNASKETITKDVTDLMQDLLKKGLIVEYQ
ncbi:MAG: PqqD family protein [Deltaproteobacteria bacterium]|jgi:DNA-binding MarR family transcriptional regulator|nr:PqqD family protein [Deltaproteobacteria bacterium]